MSNSTAAPAQPLAPGQAGKSQNVTITATDLSLMFTVTIWGFNFVIVKAVLGVISPMSFLAVRMTLAMGLMLLLYRLSGGSFRFSRREWAEMFGLGLLSNTAYQLGFINGIDRTTAGNAALIQAAMPVLVAVGSHLLRLDRLRPVAWLGVLLSFLGLYFVIRGGPTRITFGDESFIGDLFLLGAVVAWTAYTLLSRRVLAKHPPLRVTAISMLGGVPPLVILGVPSLLTESWRELPSITWLAILYSGGLSIATAYLLWNRGVLKVGGPRAAVYANLVPVVAVVAASVFLGEALGWIQLAGGAVIFAGIVLTRIRA
jgi:drug/metabolite transporter (DMT)-like permease